MPPLRAVIAAAAVALAVTATSPPVHAAAPSDTPIPTYICDRTVAGVKHKGWGWLNCGASRGAPVSGEVYGTFLILSRKESDPALACQQKQRDNYPSGRAQLPDQIIGFFCAPVSSG
ncbi:hypothetical protein [Actinomadura rudentiformis]|uniref:Secreted protein n=1 Tax=Actinomadura rudentiformis TaxID=359158 RepID=A0A6H9Z0F6_9ACTN|nr:hypothetical protein [Actinomadura rudentiformis]KAB2348800.1 hypothetical protein F8566_13550 [Actinomadura rudentiformis]